MGIVNVTPDSFSDGGKYHQRDAAIAHALQLAKFGAGILDVGGESTRPYSDAVSVDEELNRVVPVIESIVKQTDVPVSVDTSKADVAAAAIAAGAEIINDVTGLTGDPEMMNVAVSTGAGVCAMHMQGTPQTMQDDPQYDDVTEDVLKYLMLRKKALLTAGIERERICLDPGIGFGKTHQHNWQLMRDVERFHETGCPVLVGHSRKGFIGKSFIGKTLDSDQTNQAHQVDEANAIDLDARTLGLSVMLALAEIQVIRVHEVQRTVQAIGAALEGSGRFA